MLIQCGAAKRILICTPSNKAVDEILDRVSTLGLITQTNDGWLEHFKSGDLQNKVIRVHSSEYDGQHSIKKHFLAFRTYCQFHNIKKEYQEDKLDVFFKNRKDSILKSRKWWEAEE